jgi:LacI family transcriptional regulator
MNYGNSNADDGYINAHKLMRLQEPPTALFCGTDRMAMGAYDAVRELGFSIPDQMSIVGFDDQEMIGAYLRPALSTVALPFFEMGWQAVMHLNSVRGDGDQQVVTNETVPCRYVERRSVLPLISEGGA